MALRLLRPRAFGGVNDAIFVGDNVSQTITFDLRDVGFDPPLNSQPIEVRIGQGDASGASVVEHSRWNVTLFFNVPPGPGGTIVRLQALY